MEDEKSSNDLKKNKKNVRTISIIGVILSVLGILDTTYLTVAHYNTKVVLACPSTGIIDCAKVTSSSYSEVFGIPVALLGLLFFVGMLALQLPMVWKSKSDLVRKVRLAYSLVGLATVFWLVFVEFHRLSAICLYCTYVHILTFSLFVVTIIGTSIIAPRKSEQK